MAGARDLRVRTKEFGLRVIHLSSSLPRDLESQVMRRQMVRSGTSVGAQYREACRARSPAEFRSKMHSALQELEETEYWLEMLVESKRVAQERMIDLLGEVNELIAIFVASIKTSAE
jgi:four helix bundle protein